MPVDFNPPPLPTQEIAAVASKSNARDEGDDVFALLLAGLGASLEPPTEATARGEDKRRLPRDASDPQADATLLLATGLVVPAVPPVRVDAPQAIALQAGAAQDAAVVSEGSAPRKDASALLGDATDARSAKRPPPSTTAIVGDEIHADGPSQRANPIEARPVLSNADALREFARLAPSKPAGPDPKPAELPNPAASEPVSSSVRIARDEVHTEAKPVEIALTTSIAPPASETPLSSLPQAHALSLPPLHSGASAAAPPVVVIAQPVGDPAWAGVAASRMAQIVFAQHERAEIRVHPAELGPIQIRVDLDGDQASITIVSAIPQTRDALEQSLPQLRELLAQGGITLGQAFVHDGSAGDHPDGRPSSPAARSIGDLGIVDDVPLAPRTVTPRLVDVFA